MGCDPQRRGGYLLYIPQLNAIRSAHFKDINWSFEDKFVAFSKPGLPVTRKHGEFEDSDMDRLRRDIPNDVLPGAPIPPKRPADAPDQNPDSEDDDSDGNGDGGAAPRLVSGRTRFADNRRANEAAHANWLPESYQINSLIESLSGTKHYSKVSHCRRS